ncbi:hypothetical protein [Actinomadura keratinilytica]|uniref:hypothetical protein n=1 Tax=Actinomadura keratinilytica TaxID=547461 RepID=UPI0031E675BA
MSRRPRDAAAGVPRPRSADGSGGSSGGSGSASGNGGRPQPPPLWARRGREEGPPMPFWLRPVERERQRDE